MTDADRIALDSWIEAQDPDAFKSIVKRYAGMVYGTCLRILRNPADAEDVTQESFAALAFAKDASKVRSLGAWLHQVATHLALRRIRSEARRAQRDTRYGAESAASVVPAHDDVMRHVDEAIMELPEHLRMPLVAYYLQDRAQTAIAEELGVSRQLVTHRVAQGLEQLRKTLRRKDVSIAAAALATALTESAKAEVPGTLLATLGKAALAGSGATTAPHIATIVAGMGHAGIMGGLAVSKSIAIAIATVATISLGMAATCDRSHEPTFTSNESLAAEATPSERVTELDMPVADETQPDAVESAYELRMTGKTEEAKALLLETVEHNPNDARAFFELARTAMHGILPHDLNGDRKAGEKHVSENERLAGWAIQKAIEADPENPRYQYWSGLIASYSAVARIHKIWTLPSVPGCISDSLDAYETALKLDPDYHQARYEVAGLYDRLPFYLGGSKRKFKKHLKELEARSPVWATRVNCEQSPDVRTVADRVVELNKDLARWDAVLAKYPDSPEVHEGIARTHMNLYRFDSEPEEHAADAYEHIEATLALDPSRIYLLKDFAETLYLAKDYVRAEEAIREFLDADPVAPLAADGMRLLAKIYDAQNRPQDAAQLREQADAIHPLQYLPVLPPSEFFAPPE